MFKTQLVSWLFNKGSIFFCLFICLNVQAEPQYLEKLSQVASNKTWLSLLGYTREKFFFVGKRA